MICYLDSSALVKRYLTELGSAPLRQFIANADTVGTVSVSRAEVIAAFAKAARLGSITREIAEASRRIFRIDWNDLGEIDLTDALIDRACDLAWSYGLRGYDSVQLAAALSWQEDWDVPLTLATFDTRLWEAAARVGLDRYPHVLPGIR